MDDNRLHRVRAAYDCVMTCLFMLTVLTSVAQVQHVQDGPVLRCAVVGLRAGLHSVCHRPGGARPNLASNCLPLNHFGMWAH